MLTLWSGAEVLQLDTNLCQGMKLHDATGLEFLILSVRGEPTDSLPRTIYASEKASTFFLGEGKADTFMKAFEKSCSGCKVCYQVECS
jgi:hypothetical protein